VTEVLFKGWRCRVKEGHYGNGRKALQLVDAEDGSPIATASVNLSDEPLGEGEVFVKNWSENEGMVEALTVAGIVEPTSRVVVSGYVTVPVCRLKGGRG
jgi:Rieske Fe-S protein